MTKAVAAVAEAPVPVAKKAKKEAGPVEVFVTSKDLASRCGVKPTVLRRFLRTLPHFQDSEYTRYKWKPEDPSLDDIVNSFKKFQLTEAEKAEKRKATIKEKSEKIATAEKAITNKVAAVAPAKAAKKKAPVAVPAPEPVAEAVEDEDELEEDDDFEELE